MIKGLEDFHDHSRPESDSIYRLGDEAMKKSKQKFVDLMFLSNASRF